MVSFKTNILPLFRPQDISCMKAQGVFLDNYSYMSSANHAEMVYQQLSSGNMPPDGPWPPSNVQLFNEWIEDGKQP
ncbi:MAG: hypothetical protein JST12_18000 [Armatimonadetes bacterium]|nr:hypothetical protein [Armatimonadota bacterium]MBS1703563.1 hypothetical protein [Armatimonadota bacterium]MBS1728998.1 hypothetical protein [Armatimonadota bacterium]